MKGPFEGAIASDVAHPKWGDAKGEQFQLDPDSVGSPHEPGEAFVFRDFERSKVRAIRMAIEASPLRYSLIFITMVLFWTAMMSAGSGMHGDNSVALNLIPHVALYCAILGIFFYPTRLLWVPFATFIAIFAYPFFQPIVRTEPWYQQVGLDLHLSFHLFLLNLAAAALIGLSMRVFYFYTERHLRPHIADLNLCVFAYCVFVTICLLQLYVAIHLHPIGNPEDAIRLGFDDSLTTLATNRIFRGAVVLTMFLLAVIEIPDRNELTLGLACATLIPTLGLLQSMGLTLYPMLDIAIFGMVLVILLPVPSGVLAVIVGVPVYSALTGEFLNDVILTDPSEILLERYSLISIALVAFILTFRSRSRHLLRSKDSSMRRLNRVRDFAGVGLFSINISADRYRVDSTASRILGCAHAGDLSEFLQCFDLDSRDELTSVFARRTSHGDTMTIGVHGPDGHQTSLQLLVWSETAASGDMVTYGLMLDVTENNRRKEALQTAVDELSLREEKQRQLFSIVSHEVRTPASIISMLIDDLPMDKGATTVGQLRDASDQLLSVLGDMRQAVNPDKNLPIRREAFQPKELANSIINSLQKTAANASTTLILELGQGADIYRMGDTVRSRQILTNLVRNAIIHSGGSQISLSYKLDQNCDGDALSIWTVTDDGTGIDPDDVATIFEPFERGKSKGRNKKDGSGLGLFIARSAVTVMGGTLDYEPAPTGGARFIVTLPEAEAEDHAAERLAKSKMQEVRASPNLVLLLAEDNPIVAEVMCSRLRRDFTTVRLAADGMALLSAFETDQPDVILTDLFMPLLDGDKATTELRTRGFKGPIIGLTAAAVGEEADRFAAAGCDEVMFKPLDVKKLHAILVRHFEAQAEA
jgi:signal transduction histidine kinase/ActR/RegA family two-component response regulator